ncbi:RsfA family transcriptional regulator [Pseudogracilibacillus sp. SE30717A]|uniref:RsfA family transcriptional regulator n=1 Tax=Pseudogracilibacillus sp. SE30717A TaxID=3098293 RepID=UPI00300E2138
MNRPRQDAWTKDEDILLAEIVLRHIRNGKTQLEAFKKAGEALSRTPAACGFRWNASIRKKHSEAINLAKNNRKQSIFEKTASMNINEQHTIESAISMLEKVKENVVRQQENSMEDQRALVQELQNENSRLKEEVKRYREAWEEMKNVWEWIENKNEH